MVDIAVEGGGSSRFISNRTILGSVDSIERHLNAIDESLGGGKFVSGLGILENYRRSFTRSLEDFLGRE